MELILLFVIGINWNGLALMGSFYFAGSLSTLF